MDALRALCALPGSRLGTAARAQLAGVHTTLSELLRAWPDDQGAEQCRAALREVEHLLAPAADEPAPPQERAGARPARGPAPVPAAARAPARGAAPEAELAALVEELAASTEAADYLGPLRLPDPADPAGTPGRWLWLHTTLLRLPGTSAAKWRERARSAAPAAKSPAGEQWIEWWAHEREQVLVPPLPHLGAPGIRLTAAGARPDWALDATDAAAAHLVRGAENGTPLGVWVQLAGWVSGLAQLDGQLHHCLESLTHRGTLALHSPEHRDAYQHEISQRLTRFARAPEDSPAALRAALAVDEALCSVIHLPPAAAGSWWAEVAETSQRTVLALRRSVQGRGADVDVKALAPSAYRDARQRTGGNDIPLDAGGRKGQVLAGLRLWARIDGRELPGRVVYRG
ncbi:hypothetical protein [Streptomyces sp. NPDC055189]